MRADFAGSIGRVFQVLKSTDFSICKGADRASCRCKCPFVPLLCHTLLSNASPFPHASVARGAAFKPDSQISVYLHPFGIHEPAPGQGKSCSLADTAASWAMPCGWTQAGGEISKVTQKPQCKSLKIEFYCENYILGIMAKAFRLHYIGPLAGLQYLNVLLSAISGA